MMQADSEYPRYDPVAVFLHWTIGLLIIGMIPLGFFMGDLPESIRFSAYDIHKSVGITVLGLSLFRLIWRLLNAPPALPASVPAHERLIAKATHWLFYVLIVAMPLTGWLMVSASRKFPTVYFGLAEVPFIPMPMGINGKATAHQFNHYHEWLAYGALVLIVLHIAAALKHHWIDKDVVLKRMLPRFM